MAEAIFRKNWQNLPFFPRLPREQNKVHRPRIIRQLYRLQGLLGTRKPVQLISVIVLLIPTMNYAPAAVE